MSWHCVEERTADPIGRIVRKMIFTDIYENEHYAKGKIAIPKEIQLEVRSHRWWRERKKAGVFGAVD